MMTSSVPRGSSGAYFRESVATRGADLTRIPSETVTARAPRTRPVNAGAADGSGEEGVASGNGSAVPAGERRPLAAGTTPGEPEVAATPEPVGTTLASQAMTRTEIMRTAGAQRWGRRIGVA